MSDAPENIYVSRGGLKLAAALDAFALDVRGFTCADLGCNVGGFTDCLLQRGAAKVYAVDTGYGTLAWKLRSDPRVVVMERTNAMHCDVPPPQAEIRTEGEGDPRTAVRGLRGIDLAVIDLAWTKQKHAIPAALRWNPRRIITLIKPHYESDVKLAGGVLDDAEAARIAERVLGEFAALGVKLIAHLQSPVRGGAGKGNKAGNVEYLALLERGD